MLKEEDYHRKGFIPPYKTFDPKVTTSKHNMDTNIHSLDVTSNPLSRKKVILPMTSGDKLGKVWGN